MASLYFLEYNNYYNRKVKILESVNLASNYMVEYLDNVNFKIGDGIDTSVVVNSDKDIEGCDYVIEEGFSNSIKSRWFIMDCHQTRGDQYKLFLHRDVLADHLEAFLNAPFFVDKAIIPNVGDNTIFNPEGNAYNQIKKNQEILHDNTHCPWIVGYIAKNADFGTTEITASYTNNNTYDEEAQSIQNWQYYDELNQDFKADISDIDIKNYFKFNCDEVENLYKDNTIGIFHYGVSKTNSVIRPISNEQENIIPGGIFAETNGSVVGPAYGYTLNRAGGSMTWTNSNPTQYISNSEKVALLQKYQNRTVERLKSKNFLLAIKNYYGYARPNCYKFNGKILKVGTALAPTYYKIVMKEKVKTEPIYIKGNDAGLINNTFFNYNYNMNYVNASYSMNPDAVTVVKVKYKVITPTLEPLARSVKVQLSGGHYKTIDSQYDMFAIPYGDMGLFDNDVMVERMNANAGLAIANAIQEFLTPNKCYDLQLVPYCPIRYTINDSTPERGVSVNGILYSPVLDSEGTTVSAVFWCQTCKDSFEIDKPLKVADDPINFKVQHETEFYRLVSPNHASIFEFKATSNRGVSGFKVDFTYKPFSPYIQIRPKFNSTGLYGNDYEKDARGLICQGDFSLSQVSDAWNSYQINNKNYLNAFNRQIDNLEVNRKYQRIGETAGLITGALGAGVQSGMFSGVMGGPAGAIAGAGLGAGASLAGGIIDRTLSEGLYKENKSFITDNFHYNLENIQALPNTLSKVSSLDNANTFIPLLERYDATDEEKIMLQNQFKWNGMTIGKIGSVADYAGLTQDKSHEGDPAIPDDADPDMAKYVASPYAKKATIKSISGRTIKSHNLSTIQPKPAPWSSLGQLQDKLFDLGSNTTFSDLYISFDLKNASFANGSAALFRLKNVADEDIWFSAALQSLVSNFQRNTPISEHVNIHIQNKTFSKLYILYNNILQSGSLENLMISTSDVPYEPYFEGLRSAKVTGISVISGDIEKTYPIPAEVQALNGYGQSNPDNNSEANYIDFIKKKYIKKGHIENGAWISEEQTETDITSYFEGSGLPTFDVSYLNDIFLNNQYNMDMPNTIGYTGNEAYIDPLGKYRFIRGRLIRLIDFNGDTHLANEIANELVKGVYI